MMPGVVLAGRRVVMLFECSGPGVLKCFPFGFSGCFGGLDLTCCCFFLCFGGLVLLWGEGGSKAFFGVCCFGIDFGGS